MGARQGLGGSQGEVHVAQQLVPYPPPAEGAEVGTCLFSATRFLLAAPLPRPLLSAPERAVLLALFFVLLLVLLLVLLVLLRDEEDIDIPSNPHSRAAWGLKEKLELPIP